VRKQEGKFLQLYECFSGMDNMKELTKAMIIQVLCYKWLD
jgi:hypothetical protein